MNTAEFGAWLRYHSQHFPPFHSWLNGLDSDTMATQASAMQATLASTSLEDAKLVTQRMYSGRLPAVEGYRHHETAAEIRKHCAAMQPWQPNDPVPRMEDATAAGQMPIKEAIKQYAAKRNAGAPKASLDEWLKSVYPDDPGSDPRYRCLRCRDTGIRDVYSAVSVRAAMKGRPPKEKVRAAAVACQCDRGGRYPGLPRFDTRHHCPCPMGRVADHLDDLMAWVESQQQASVRAMPNYVSDFDDF